MFFLRRLWSFNICRKLLSTLQSMVASVLSGAVVCWGARTSKTDLQFLKADQVGWPAGWARTCTKLPGIMDNIIAHCTLSSAARKACWATGFDFQSAKPANWGTLLSLFPSKSACPLQKFLVNAGAGTLKEPILSLGPLDGYASNVG